MSHSVASFAAAAFAASLTLSGLAKAEGPEPVSAPATDTPAPGPAAAKPVDQPAAVAAPKTAQVEDDSPLTRRELRQLPKHRAYSDGDPVPEHYVVQTSARKGLVAGGAAAIGAPWVISVLSGAISRFSNQSGWLAVPVAGPWLTYSLRRDCLTHACEDNQAHRDANGFIKTMLLIDGGVQAVGLALLVTGIVFTKTELVREDLAKVWIVPSSIGQSGYGLSAVGRF